MNGTEWVGYRFTFRELPILDFSARSPFCGVAGAAKRARSTASKALLLTGGTDAMGSLYGMILNRIVKLRPEAKKDRIGIDQSGTGDQHF